jgi:(E)-4-hydroxy-3-methylbut-2-enyl-diphosphate synthase
VEKYCESVVSGKRRLTREVMVGCVGMGAHHPVRLQSMTTSDTRDVEATVEQILRLEQVGCEIARVTVQGKKEAYACEKIKSTLVQRGCNIPLVADIHFYPPAAMIVADFVDKVRVNPGNYVDRRATFKELDFTKDSYSKEIDKLEEKFSPLVLKCKSLGVAMRIGTNHGSLSDRIMSRYGDTPQGMVESALEFARICRQHDYHQFVFSMKASYPPIMIQAYRMLVASMYKLDWDYPLHLGVTEAGEGVDGRVKSSVGIGSLLLDGLGDTIRVSLTEDPWNEIDPAKRLASFSQNLKKSKEVIHLPQESYRTLEMSNKRSVDISNKLYLHEKASIFLPVRKDESIEEVIEASGLDQSGIKKDPLKSVEGLLLEDSISLENNIFLNKCELGVFSLANDSMNSIDRFALHPIKKFPKAFVVDSFREGIWDSIKEETPEVIFLSPKTDKVAFCRAFTEEMYSKGLKTPLILAFSYDTCDEQDFMIQASMECGSLLCDGIGEGICLNGPFSLKTLASLSFQILQAVGVRIFKTEFVSCPGCGRTLFDLVEVSKRIREQTQHLAGVKIAIMGCIVNGPGEMADADFGYVGSGVGKIDLYVGKQCVEKGIDFSQADEKLIELIKSHGKWKEPVLVS